MRLHVWIVCGLCLAVGGVAAPHRAHAKEASEGAALATRLVDATREGDKTAARREAKAAAGLHNRCPSRVARKRIQDALGALLLADNMGSASLAAADALARLDDPKPGWAYLKRAMPSVKSEAVDLRGIRVLRAVGHAAYGPSAKVLHNFAAKSKDPNAVGVALVALGEFRFVKGRERILGDVLDLAKSLPGRARPTGAMNADQARRAWTRVGDAALQALNALTGRREAALEDWQSLWKRHRREPAKLFTLPLGSTRR